MKKNTFIIILLLIALIALVGVYYTSSSTPNNTKEEEQNQSTLIKNALAGKTSAQCSYTSVIEGENYKTFVYIKNGQIASETPVGQNTAVHFVMTKDQTGYAWQDMKEIGYTFELSLDTSDGQNLTSLVQSFSTEKGTNISKPRCIEGNVSKSRFSIPENVEFKKFDPNVQGTES